MPTFTTSNSPAIPNTNKPTFSTNKGISVDDKKPTFTISDGIFIKDANNLEFTTSNGFSIDNTNSRTFDVSQGIPPPSNPTPTFNH